MKFAVLRQNHIRDFSKEKSRLKRELEKWEATVGKLETMDTAERNQYKLLEDERQQHVLSALGDENETAMLELRRLQSASDWSKQKVSDIGVALVQAGAKVDQLRAELRQVERCEHIQQLRDLVHHRLESGQRFQTFCDNVVAEFQELEKTTVTIQREAVHLGVRKAELTGVDRIMVSNALACIGRRLSQAAQMEIGSAIRYGDANATFADIENQQCELLLEQLSEVAGDSSVDDVSATGSAA